MIKKSMTWSKKELREFPSQSLRNVLTQTTKIYGDYNQNKEETHCEEVIGYIETHTN